MLGLAGLAEGVSFAIPDARSLAALVALGILLGQLDEVGADGVPHPA